MAVTLRLRPWHTRELPQVSDSESALPSTELRVDYASSHRFLHTCDTTHYRTPSSASAMRGHCARSLLSDIVNTLD